MEEKVVALVSGGIDSPVAAHLMMRKRIAVLPLFLDNYPFAFSDTLDKAAEATEALFGKKQLYVMNHGGTLAEVLRQCPRHLTCVLCRRMMFRAAEAFAEKSGACGIVTGEFLGSKASQTAVNLGIVSRAVRMPVLRPLLCYNKEETLRIAQRIGTYGASTKPAMCCTVTPEHPETGARIAEVLRAEQRIDAQALTDKSMETLKLIQ